MGASLSDLSKAVIVHPLLPGDAGVRGSQSRLHEAVGLAEAIELDVVTAFATPVAKPRPATLLGAGKVQDIRDLLDASKPRPGLVIVDGALTPVQHRNLEKAWDAKVLDRTALILEIFGERAHTSEGALQVELAHLTYQRSRLVRSWTHLERQRGGAGFLGGPGERQIESDRRALAVKIDKLKSKLEQVKRTRTLQRARRQRAPYPVVAFVGYTNAGKSTLFNRMTNADVSAKDLLFATLDPTMRAAVLRSGQQVILSDTVGFISDLPTHLVAAFQATLEEVLEADVIVHVRDAAHPDSEAQRQDVLSVLASLGIDEQDERPVIEVLNKIDLLDADARASLEAASRLTHSRNTISLSEPVRVALSALTGEGLETLNDVIDALVTAERKTYTFELPAHDGAARASLHAAGDVLGEYTRGENVRMTVRLSAKSRGQFEKAHPGAVMVLPERAARRRA